MPQIGKVQMGKRTAKWTAKWNPGFKLRIKFTSLFMLGILIVSGIFGFAQVTEFTWRPIVYGMVIGGSIGGPILYAEYFVFNGGNVRILSRVPFLGALFIRVLVYMFFILFGVVVVGNLLLGAGDNDMGLNILFSLIMSVIVNLVQSVNQLLGPRVLRNFILGRYHQPREERHFLLFIDLANSTTITERIGNLRYHAFLRRFFMDVTAEVMDSGGDIHKYVGDEVIITWSERAGARSGTALGFPLAVARRIEAAAASYHREFGTVPVFRAGLHYGSIVAGEIGLWKQEIAYIGDAMNVAARIEQAARTLGRPFLASEDAVVASDPPQGVRLNPLGTVPVSGRVQQVSLFALEQQE
jgi:adenylate cyclase